MSMNAHTCVTRIVLADDHAVVRAGIQKVIEELPNMEVVDEVEDGPSLVRCLRETRPDCLLVDLHMPDFDPLQTIPEIRRQYPSMKILVVSVYDDGFYVQKLLEAGVDGYHLKDQPLSDLKLAVRRVLEGERWISSPLISKLVDKRKSAPTIPRLTVRQRDILRLLQEGLDNQAIALELNLSIKTVENHLTRLYKLLEVGSRLEAANYANQHPEILGITGEQAAQLQFAKAYPRRDVTLLLVDDNFHYLQQLQRVLGKVCPKADLYTANSIMTAVRMAQRVHPDIALIDVILGEEDGIRCARRIKAVSRETRIIMVSAYPDREFRRLSIEAGAIAFLDKKDLDARALKQVIEDILTSGLP
ncbi:MAG: response regulator transcription factor [Chloroflexi bacterium]|nr:response regulator transcription factor [Chloroflexota bacterium]